MSEIVKFQRITDAEFVAGFIVSLPATMGCMATAAALSYQPTQTAEQPPTLNSTETPLIAIGGPIVIIALAVGATSAIRRRLHTNNLLASLRRDIAAVENGVPINFQS
jgi:hypothetical protein